MVLDDTCTAKKVERTLIMVIQRVNGWMNEHGFTLALDKTEMVVLINKSIPTILSIQVGETCGYWLHDRHEDDVLRADFELRTQGWNVCEGYCQRIHI